MVAWLGEGVFSIKLLASLNVSYEFQNISSASPVRPTGQVLIVWPRHAFEIVVFMPPEQLSTAAVRRLIEMAGADRVGDDAVEELGKMLEDFAVKVGKEATGLARHAGRKTVKAQDIQLAIKRVPPP
jgi:histone H3/H4